jgi:hypothetical protein
LFYVPSVPGDLDNILQIVHEFQHICKLSRESLKSVGDALGEKFDAFLREADFVLQ